MEKGKCKKKIVELSKGIEREDLIEIVLEIN